MTHRIRSRIGRHVIVFGLLPQQGIAHTPPRHVGDESSLAECVDDPERFTSRRTAKESMYEFLLSHRKSIHDGSPEALQS